MSLRVGFSETEITPPLGTHKIGFKRVIVSDHVLDPLYARIAVIESHGSFVGFVQLDTCCVLWQDAQEIRRRIAASCEVPEQAIMVSATHNHAGPAVADSGDVNRDDEYVERMIEDVVAGSKRAMEARRPAEVGFGSCFEFDVGHNRRVVMRDGTVRTHGKFTDSDALFVEGPVDPEVSVTAFRQQNGAMLGAIVNFACHPTHHGAGAGLSGGYPGVLARRLKSEGCPVTLFLNGAAGNVHTANPADEGADSSMEQVGLRLAIDVTGVIDRLGYQDSLPLSHATRLVDVPFRRVTDAEIKGDVHGAQRFIDSGIYDREMDDLVKMIKEKKSETAEVQAIWLGDRVYVSIPGELFVELGLRIKEKAYPVRATVVGYANGNLGYLPHLEAFARGGYETTFCGASRMAPEAGTMLSDAALQLIRASSGRDANLTGA